MANLQSTLPNDEKEAQDSAYNPGEKLAREQTGSHDSLPGYDRSADGLDDNPDFKDDADAIRQGEENGTVGPPAGWDTNVTGGEIDKPALQKALTFAKKRIPLIGLISVLGISGGIAATFLGPATMAVSLMENFTSSNDSTTTSMQRRIMKVFGSITTGDPSGVCAKATSIRCKEGHISNSALRKLSAKGIVPYGAPGETIDIKGTGYRAKNPVGYTIDLGDGSKPKNIPAEQLPGFLTKYPKMAAKMLGAGGAFNLRLKAWSGKYMTAKLFDRFKLGRVGGIADGKNKTGKFAEMFKKLGEKIPGLEKLGNIKAAVGEKVSARMGAAKKGGSAYAILVGGCIAEKAPSFIAAGVAAEQIAQILPVVENVILSPGSKIKAAGVDPATHFTSEDASGIGNLLTEKTPRTSDGKLSSALDSPYLQSAIGLNKNKLPISSNYTPGFSVLESPIVSGSIAAEKATAPECNALMTPAATTSAAIADAAGTVIASTTVAGGVIKVLAGYAIQDLESKVASLIVGNIAEAVITGIASSNIIPQAKGEDLGTVIGLGAMAFFSSGGMARSLPALKMSQLSKFVALQQQDQKFQRDMDIASLSPFDTSSQYTFMGSIVHNMNMATISSGSYGGGVLSMLSSAVKVPFGLSDTANAAPSFSETSCGYAANFHLDEPNPADSPAVNLAGLPCTGISDRQATMATDDAIKLVEDEHWLDESKPIEDGATITDLVKSGYIVADTPLSNYIESCSDASTGNYMYNAASCTIDTTPTATSGLSSIDSLNAIPVFLLDFQSAQMINGEDDGNSTTVATAVADATIDQAHIYEDSSSIACVAGAPDAGINQGYVNGKEVDVRLCSIPNTIDMGDDSKGKQPIRVNSRVSGAVLQMITALIASPVNNGKVPLRVSDSFRSMAAQRAVAAEYADQLGRAAPAGHSPHQMGLAIDFQLSLPIGNSGATRPGEPTYDWLVANAKNYGFAKLEKEAWHWQPIAAQGSAPM